MIQIFGTKKCNNTKKAQRFFKERGIKIQFIDLRECEMSRGELQSVISAVGGIESLLDDGARARDSLALIRHLLPEAQFERLAECPEVMRTPVVRLGRLATVGYEPDTWKKWLEKGDVR